MVIRSGFGQVLIRIIKEIFVQVNGSHDGSGHLPVLSLGLDLHNLCTAEHEYRIGIRVVSTAMGAFKRIDQDFDFHLGNGAIPDGGMERIGHRLVLHIHLGRIRDVAKVRLRSFMLLLIRSTSVEVIAYRGIGVIIVPFTTTTKVIGIRKEGVPFLVPNQGCERIMEHAVARSFRQLHTVTLVIKAIRFVTGNLDSMQHTRNAGRPHILLVRVNHQVPNTRRSPRRGDNALSITRTRRLTHFVNGGPLSCDNQATIRVMHDTIGTAHAITFRTKNPLVFQLQITITVIVIVEALDAVILRVFRIIQRFCRRRMRDDIANLLNPNTRSGIGRFAVSGSTKSERCAS